jgi:hypothetical protein
VRLAKRYRRALSRGEFEEVEAQSTVGGSIVNLGAASQSRLGLGVAGVMSWMSFDAVGMPRTRRYTPTSHACSLAESSCCDLFRLDLSRSFPTIHVNYIVVFYQHFRHSFSPDKHFHPLACVAPKIPNMSR